MMSAPAIPLPLSFPSLLRSPLLIVGIAVVVASNFQLIHGGVTEFDVGILLPSGGDGSPGQGDGLLIDGGFDPATLGIVAEPVTVVRDDDTDTDDCIINQDRITIRIPGLTDETLTYELQYKSNKFWFGMESLDEGSYSKGKGSNTTALGGTASFYLSRSEGAHGDFCAITGRMSSTVAKINIVFRTRLDGSVWAELVTNEELDEDEDETDYIPLPQSEGENNFEESNMDVPSDTGSVIDIMVPYTEQALCRESLLPFPCNGALNGSHVLIENRINFFVAESQAVFYNTGLKLQLNVVHSYLVTDFVENPLGVTSFDDVEDAMLNETDVLFDSLPGFRDQHCADLVLLLVAFADIGGSLGSVGDIGPNEDEYVAVISLEASAISGYTWTHETGHLLASTF